MTVSVSNKWLIVLTQEIKNSIFVQGRRQKIFQGGRGNGKKDRKFSKKGLKIALFSLYPLYLYHVWKSKGATAPWIFKHGTPPYPSLPTPMNLLYSLNTLLGVTSERCPSPWLKPGPTLCIVNAMLWNFIEHSSEEIIQNSIRNYCNVYKCFQYNFYFIQNSWFVIIRNKENVNFLKFTRSKWRQL